MDNTILQLLFDVKKANCQKIEIQDKMLRLFLPETIAKTFLTLLKNCLQNEDKRINKAHYKNKHIALTKGQYTTLFFNFLNNNENSYDSKKALIDSELKDVIEVVFENAIKKGKKQFIIDLLSDSTGLRLLDLMVNKISDSKNPIITLLAENVSVNEYKVLFKYGNHKYRAALLNFLISHLFAQFKLLIEAFPRITECLTVDQFKQVSQQFDPLSRDDLQANVDFLLLMIEKTQNIDLIATLFLLITDERKFFLEPLFKKNIENLTKKSVLLNRLLNFLLEHELADDLQIFLQQYRQQVELRLECSSSKLIWIIQHVAGLGGERDDCNTVFSNLLMDNLVTAITGSRELQFAEVIKCIFASNNTTLLEPLVGKLCKLKISSNVDLFHQLIDTILSSHIEIAVPELINLLKNYHVLKQSDELAYRSIGKLLATIIYQKLRSFFSGYPRKDQAYIFLLELQAENGVFELLCKHCAPAEIIAWIRYSTSVLAEYSKKLLAENSKKLSDIWSFEHMLLCLIQYQPVYILSEVVYILLEVMDNDSLLAKELNDKIHRLLFLMELSGSDNPHLNHIISQKYGKLLDVDQLIREDFGEAWESNKESVQQTVSFPVIAGRLPLKQDKWQPTIKEIAFKTKLELGTALDRGDCFFDAFAQALEDKGFEIPGERGKPSYKKLRLLCDSYIKQLDKQSSSENWVKTAMNRDAELGGADYRTCLVQIQYTQAELEDVNSPMPAKTLATWGRPTIEGKILCDVLSKQFNQPVSLHIIELQELEDKLIGDKLVSIHSLANSQGQKEIAENEVDYAQKSQLHLINYRQHYVPLISHQANLTQFMGPEKFLHILFEIDKAVMLKVMDKYILPSQIMINRVFSADYCGMLLAAKFLHKEEDKFIKFLDSLPSELWNMQKRSHFKQSPLDNYIGFLHFTFSHYSEKCCCTVIEKMKTDWVVYNAEWAFRLIKKLRQRLFQQAAIQFAERLKKEEHCHEALNEYFKPNFNRIKQSFESHDPQESLLFKALDTRVKDRPNSNGKKKTGAEFFFEDLIADYQHRPSIRDTHAVWDRKDQFIKAGETTKVHEEDLYKHEKRANHVKLDFNTGAINTCRPYKREKGFYLHSKKTSVSQLPSWGKFLVTYGQHKKISTPERIARSVGLIFSAKACRHKANFAQDAGTVSCWWVSPTAQDIEDRKRHVFFSAGERRKFMEYVEKEASLTKHTETLAKVNVNAILAIAIVGDGDAVAEARKRAVEWRQYFIEKYGKILPIINYLPGAELKDHAEEEFKEEMFKQKITLYYKMIKEDYASNRNSWVSTRFFSNPPSIIHFLERLIAQHSEERGPWSQAWEDFKKLLTIKSEGTHRNSKKYNAFLSKIQQEEAYLEAPAETFLSRINI